MALAFLDIMGRAPWNLSDHHNAIVLRDSRGGPWLFPHYAERRQSLGQLHAWSWLFSSLPRYCTWLPQHDPPTVLISSTRAGCNVCRGGCSVCTKEVLWRRPSVLKLQKQMAGFDPWISCKNTVKSIVSWIRLNILVNSSVDSRVKCLQLMP